MIVMDKYTSLLCTITSILLVQDKACSVFVVRGHNCMSGLMSVHTHWSSYKSILVGAFTERPDFRTSCVGVFICGLSFGSCGDGSYGFKCWRVRL